MIPGEIIIEVLDEKFGWCLQQLVNFDNAESELEQLQQELASISFEIPEKGTVGQILKDSNPFLKKIDSLKVNIDLLIEEIKKKGLALNIDIF